MREAKKWKIIYSLLERGYITRNECLRNYISRLGARIQDLEDDYGWEFTTFRKGGDYGYRVAKRGRNHLLAQPPLRQLTLV